MHCLLTGASGYLGRALLPALLERGCAVTALAFRGAIDAPATPQLAVQRGDLVEQVARLPLEGIDQVFHLAGIAHQRADADAYRAVNVEATRRLASRARDAGVRRFVFVSSVKAGLPRSPRPAREGPPAGDYGSAKREAEAELAAICDTGAMELVIVRPALVYDVPAPGHLAWLQRWVDLRLPAPPPGGARSMVSRADFVALCVALLERSPVPRRLTLTDGEAYTTRRLHAALCRARQRRPLLPPPPSLAWRLAARALDAVRREHGGSSWQRLAGSELHAQEGLAAIAFRPRLTFERALGLHG